MVSAMSKASGHLCEGLALRRLAKAIETTDNERNGNTRLNAFIALKRLQRSRPIIVSALKWSWRLGWKKQPQQSKLALWMAMAHPCAYKEKSELKQLRDSLEKTDAWKKAKDQLIHNRWNHRGRIHQPKQIINQLSNRKIDRLFFWHHYDIRGYLPRTWLAALEALHQRNWVVVVSSSTLSTTAKQELLERGIMISKRVNQGICLGAYRDFCLLLSEEPNLINCCNQLVLANDSCLPIGGANKFANCIDEISEQLQTNKRMIAGITDSIERDAYHIQSYLMGINSALMQNASWLKFWRQLTLGNSKDNFINQGEIGFSQAMINAGAKTWARYSLIHMLLDQPETGAELQRFAVQELNGVNLTLFAWQALLKAGCPMIKKQAIYNLKSLPIPLSQLLPWLTEDDTELRNDLEQLLRSRFSTKDMDWLNRYLKLNHSQH